MKYFSGHFLVQHDIFAQIVTLLDPVSGPKKTPILRAFHCRSFKSDDVQLRITPPFIKLLLLHSETKSRAKVALKAAYYFTQKYSGTLGPTCAKTLCSRDLRFL